MSIEEDLKIIQKQEKTLQYKNFSENEAWELGSRLREICAWRAFPLVIDVRRFGQPLFFAALPGSTPDNVEWVRRKSNTVARFYRSSYGMGLELESKGITLADRFGLPLESYAAHGGGFPISLEDSGPIGSVTVSGLPQRQDHELVVEVLCLILGKTFEDLRLP